MNNQQKQLQTVLQALAMPVTGQLRLYPNDVCKVSRLIQEYEQFEPPFLAETGHRLTMAQEDVLRSLRRDLRIMCGEASEADHACTDLALRRNVAWRRVRLLARSALLTFGWPLVPLPIAEPMLVC